MLILYGWTDYPVLSSYVQEGAGLHGNMRQSRTVWNSLEQSWTELASWEPC